MKHKGSELSDNLRLREGGNEKKTNYIENYQFNQTQITGENFYNKYENQSPNTNIYNQVPKQKVASVSSLNNVRGYLEEEKQKAYVESYPVPVHRPDSQNRNRKMSRNRNFVARKPSGEWRKGDENVFRENENLQNLKKIYSSSPGKIREY
jgi:hypothetical protein